MDLDYYDQKLYDYIREEKKFSSQEIFDELLKRYPNRKKTKLYRGLNFSSKEKYDSFVKKILINNNCYSHISISGFSPDFDTAEDFAINQKTYFPTQETIDLHTYTSLFDEKIFGYRGVIVEIEIPENSAIDVSLFDHGIESEMIISPDSNYPCKIETINPFSEEIKNIDINEHIQSIHNFDDKITKYIFNNHPSDIDISSKKHILKLLQFSKPEKEDVDLFSCDNLIIYRDKKYNFKGDITCDKTRFIVPDFLSFSLNDVFDEKFLIDDVRPICDDILFNIMSFYINNKDLKYDFSSLQRITSFCSSENIKLYNRMVNENSLNYNDIHNNFVNKMNDKDISEQNKKKILKEETDKLVNLISSIIDSKPLTKKEINIEKQKKKDKKDKIKNKIRNV